jgi:hypothetical protein
VRNKSDYQSNGRLESLNHVTALLITFVYLATLNTCRHDDVKLYLSCVGARSDDAIVIM